MKKLHVLNPLFWQRMDGHAAIREEMERMKEVGINDFIVEPRPHPDYLGPGWWDDLSFIIRSAEELDMTVWIFDDGQYPSGSAYGILAQKYPEHTKRFWRENHMDASGPLPHASFLINDWLEPGETVYKVIAAKRYQRGAAIYSDSLTDVTEYVSDGRLYWPVPDGEWRIFLIKVSPHGEEVHTNHYVNPLSRESVNKYTELIHEQHYARFREYFGSRIAGFFTDEPRFGNTVGYDRIIGKSRMPLPYTAGIEDKLDKTPLGVFDKLIPLLWYDDVEGRCADARYAYMDVVSGLFAECFTGTLGRWCRDHGVKLIGHVVEENGAHSRLGYGAGHFFRAMDGLDAAGIDVVCNLFPEQTSGNYATMFNEYDCDFNHFGLAKMASSASKLDPKKNGHTLCEAFGAYGWNEGLRMMKWITDHLAVQGVNIITPHAFSPSPFPDPDCPPHFYARGENPQFRLFRVWSDYANRLLGSLIDAVHTAPVAVVYHAEAEWGGECEPFEKAVKALAQKQIDCSVLPIDELVKPESAVVSKTLHSGGGEYKALVVPYSRFIPRVFSDKLAEFTRAGLPVIFTGALPERVYFGEKPDIAGAAVSETAGLADLLSCFADIVCERHYDDLLYSHYVKDGVDLYLFVNQSTRVTVDTGIEFRDGRPAVIYDPMTGEKALPERHGGKLRLKLYPWESRLICFGEDTDGLSPMQYEDNDILLYEFCDGFTVSVSGSAEYPVFTETKFKKTGDLALPGYLPDFSGTVRYERTFRLEEKCDIKLDLGDAYEAVAVRINGRLIREMICPPYRVNVPADMLEAGENDLVIEVTNTLVKAQHNNVFDRFFVQDPTGLTESVRIYKRP